MTLEVRTAGTTALLAAAAAAASAGSAAAADLYTKAQPSYVPAPSSWQGFYVGAGIGGSWLNSKQDDGGANFFGYGGSGQSQTANSMGFVGTLQAGYNFQDSNFVYGLEGDISWISGKATSNGSFVDYSGYTTTKTSKIDAVATLRARFGFDFNGTMPYLTAGVAIGDIKNSYRVTQPGFDVSASKSTWQPGLAVGGGIEHKFTNSPWSIKGEVLWVGFKDTNLTASGYNGGYGAPGSVKFSNSLTLGKLGLNYRF